MKLFDEESDVSIILEDGESEAVRLAARDLQDNLRRLSGKTVGFEITRSTCGRGIFVKTTAQGEPESYSVNIEEEKVTIDGADVLGTVYGIYAFSTKCLGVFPMYRLTDIFPEEREELTLANECISSDTRSVRFRGWFLNDEDLLTDWKISGGRRYIDYPFYQNVMDASVLDRILEAALRLEINLIIPSSFVDISNADEETLVQAVCRRGMYISQHHVEPMGVSFFGAANYLKNRGLEDETVSFIANRERMEEIWRYYAAKWARYGDHVIWQLGLRGKADEAVWKADPNVPISTEARGAIITDAIQTQYAIIREALGADAFHSTATLWNEGSELYGKGYLTLPETTIPVFSDFGLDQMFGEDLYSVAKKSNKKYGVYYHAAFWALGPHLTEGCDPRKMEYCYRDAASSDDLCYSILNISNVRPLHISAMINAKILQAPTKTEAMNELFMLDTELFGDAARKVNEIRREYYEAFADFGDVPLRAASKAVSFYYREFEDLPFIRNPGTDGQVVYFGKYLFRGYSYEKLPAQDENTLMNLKDSAERFSALLSKAETVESDIAPSALLYFRQFIKYQIKHMKLITEWCVHSMGLTNATLSYEERIKQGEHACACLEAILEERKILELGEWQNWHRGDKKMNIPGLLKTTKETIDKIS